MMTLSIITIGKVTDLTRGPQQGPDIEPEFVLYRAMA